MLKVLKVTGESLSPLFHDGDFVLLVKIPFIFGGIKKGNIVAFRHADYGTMIKKVDRVTTNGEGIFVVGYHKDSLDSRQFGPIPQGDLIGKVVWQIRKTQN